MHFQDQFIGISFVFSLLLSLFIRSSTAAPSSKSLTWTLSTTISNNSTASGTGTGTGVSSISSSSSKSLSKSSSSSKTTTRGVTWSGHGSGSAGTGTGSGASRTSSSIATAGTGSSRRSNSTAGVTWTGRGGNTTPGVSYPPSGTLPYCTVSSTKSASSKATGPTSWTSGACSPTTFMDPTTTVACKDVTYTPASASGCKCPDNTVYEFLSGPDVGDGCKAWIAPDNQLVVPMLQCPEFDTTPTNCVMPTSTQSSVSLPPPGGRFSVTPVYPKTCTASMIGYSSTKPLQTGQIVIDPGTEWGTVGSVWTFSAGGGAKITYLNNTSNPGTSSYEGNPEASNENYTEKADGSWTMTVVPDMPTIPLIAIVAGNLSNDSFPMTITSKVPCDVPVALNCNASDHDLNPDQWKAFRVDDFVDELTKNWTASNTPSFWDWFVQGYVGDGFATACQVDQDTGCGPLTQSCADMKPGPYLRQSYLFMSAMMTYSRYLHFAYSAYDQNLGNMGDLIPNWENFFNVPQKTQTWQNIVGASASVVGMLSVIGFAVAPFTGGASLAIGAVGSGLFGINSILNSAINFANANGAAVAAELQFDDYGHALNAYHNYINATEQALIDASNSVFQKATNVSDIFKDGHIVGDNMIKSVTDSSVSGFVANAATWMTHVGIWGMINQAWKTNDNYIVFIPYGQVNWYGDGNRDFQASDCQDHFLNNGKWNGTIYAQCDCGPADNPGMAMFMVPQNGGQLNEYNQKSFYDVEGYTAQGYTFSPRDVLISSLASYFQYGYDYSATSFDFVAALAAGKLDPFQKVADLKPTDPGVFNVPVCIITNLIYVPACTITDWPNHGGLDPCISQPSVCQSANWTNPATGNVTWFKDHVSSTLYTELGYAQGYNGYK